MEEMERRIRADVYKRVNAELEKKRSEFNQKINKVIYTLENLKFDEEERIEYRNGSVLNKSIEELNLSSRTCNALMTARIYTVGDIVAKNYVQLLGRRGLGKKALTEIAKTLEERGLKFGMDISDHLKNPEQN